jgi:hypothetical protein
MAIRLLDLEERVFFPLGTKIEGWLNLDRRKHLVLASVRNIRGDHIGCEFEGLDPTIQEHLNRSLSPSELGQTLRLIPTPVGLSGGSSGENDWIWFHGRSGTEVLVKTTPLVTGQNSVGAERIVVVLWGKHYAEWDSRHGVSTGSVRLVDAQDSVQGVFRLAPEWFSPDSALDPLKLDLAKNLVQNSKLPESWKKILAESWAVTH